MSFQYRSVFQQIEFRLHRKGNNFVRERLFFNVSNFVNLMRHLIDSFHESIPVRWNNNNRERFRLAICNFERRFSFHEHEQRKAWLLRWAWLFCMIVLCRIISAYYYTECREFRLIDERSMETRETHACNTRWLRSLICEQNKRDSVSLNCITQFFSLQHFYNFKLVFLTRHCEAVSFRHKKYSIPLM